MAHPVEQIIEDRQTSLGKASASGPILIGGFFPAKLLAQFLAVGQAQQRTINAKESVSTPALDGVIRAVNAGQHAVPIQFDEGPGFEFCPSMRHRSAGDRFKELALGQLIEKFMHMTLDGLEGLLQDKKH